LEEELVAPELWPEVKEILAAALELERPARDEYLERACAGKPAVRNEVESLIASFEDAGDFIERPVLAPGDAAQALGRRIGPYQIVELLGHGGMGSVYRAERVDSEFRQQVAIKIIKPGMDTSFVLRRFRNERQILATLDHPNIARLLDGGTTEDGVPYFVMEYIQGGRPIDQYCDQKKLPTEERLKSFLSVCAAVQSAHEKLVIHRDIKPANILVTADGTPKLLDFGIAKILDPELATTALAPTATLLRLMTPEYASPEQVRGEAITAASDVYSLGVLLYELLTGHRPYRLRSRSAYEIVQVICQGEPDRPSTAVGKTTEITRGNSTIMLTPQLVSETREGDPGKLRKKLAGDLDNIVLKAIRKEPERRYASAEQLAADIQRHLDGQRIVARGDTVTYSALKYVQRHRAPLMAALVAAVLVSVMMAFLHFRNAASPDAAAQAPRRSVAILGFRNLSGNTAWQWLSTALSEMLVSELAAGEKVRTVSGESVDEVRRVISESGGRSLTGRALARVRTAVGTDYVVLGSYVVLGPAGRATIRLDLRLQQVSSGETVASVSDTAPEADLLKLVSRAGASLRGHLGMAVARPQNSLPGNPQAARFYSEGVARLREFDTIGARDLLLQAVKEDPRHALSHSALAMAWTSLGYDAKSTEHAKIAFELSANLSREERLYLEGRYYETVRAWQRATELYRQLWASFPDTIDYGVRLVSTLIPMGKGAEAMEILRELRKLPALGGYDARLDLAEAEAATAISRFEQAREAAARVAAKASPSYSPTLIARARLFEARALSELGDFPQSVKMAEESRRLYEQDQHRRGVALATNLIAAGLVTQGDLAGARKAYETSLAVAREIGSRGGEAAALDNIGALFRQQGDFDEARRFHDQALEIRRRSGDKAGLAVSLAHMGSLLNDQGNLEEARLLLDQSLAIRQELSQRRGVARAMNLLAPTLRKQGDLGNAETMSREAARMLDEVGDRNSARQARVSLANVLFDRGDKPGARKLFEQVVDEARRAGEKSTVATALYGLGRLALSEKNLAESRRALEEAFRIQHDLGERSRESLTRLAIAELAIAEQRAAAGEILARQAIDEFRREKVAAKEAWGYAVLTQTLVAQGKSAEARRAIQVAHALLPRVEQREIRLAVEAARGRVTARR
jgi:serine/threonine protein kinase/tetratricopeptide (TPR) repeat protein